MSAISNILYRERIGSIQRFTAWYSYNEQPRGRALFALRICGSFVALTLTALDFWRGRSLRSLRQKRQKRGIVNSLSQPLHYLENVHLSAVMLFIILIISVRLILGMDCTSIWIWSLSVPISRNCIGYLSAIPLHVSMQFKSWTDRIRKASKGNGDIFM